MKDKHDIIWFKSVDSTNDEAKRRLHSIDNLSVLSALSQSAGRGQRGNSWKSSPGENLTFSIVLKYGETGFHSLPAENSFVIIEIAALSVIRLLQNHDIKAEIKWPNDIYVGQKKICGMLVENVLSTAGMKSSIVGIGLNINQIEFDPTLPNPTSMLLEVSGQKHLDKYDSDTLGGYRKFDINLLLDEFLDIFKSLSHQFLSNEADLYELRKMYLSRLWRLDTQSAFIDYTCLPEGYSTTPVITGINNDSGSEFAGIIRGLSPVGNLLVENAATGIIREFAFKEISYIL